MPITKDMEEKLILSPPLRCDVIQASAEIYKAMGRVLVEDVAMKYRMNAGEGCGLEVWRRLFHDNEGFADQVLDLKFNQFKNPGEDILSWEKTLVALSCLGAIPDEGEPLPYSGSKISNDLREEVVSHNSNDNTSPMYNKSPKDCVDFTMFISLMA